MFVGWLVAAAGLTLVVGYAFVMIYIAPNFRSTRSLARVGAVFFFMLCALTHLELAVHYMAREPIGMGELESVHMALMMVPQALAVFMFMSGLHVEQRLPAGQRALVGDRFLMWFAQAKLVNRFSDVLNRRLFLYAGAYGAVTLGSTLLGI